MPFSLSEMKQKELCSWIWVWVRGRVCIYMKGGFGGWTSNCCAERYMAFKRGVSEARGSCYRCLSVMFLLGWFVLLRLMLPNFFFFLAHSSWLKKSIEMHYSGSCARVTKKKIVYSRSRKALLLDCFCVAQFPPDGKLDGKSMKHEAEKHLKHNNKIQTLL